MLASICVKRERRNLKSQISGERQDNGKGIRTGAPPADDMERDRWFPFIRTSGGEKSATHGSATGGEAAGWASAWAPRASSVESLRARHLILKGISPLTEVPFSVGNRPTGKCLGNSGMKERGSGRGENSRKCHRYFPVPGFVPCGAMMGFDMGLG